MQAIVVRHTGGPEKLVLETLPDPAPGPGEIIVAIAACGVCFHDVVTRNGTLKAGIKLPMIPGHEVSGLVAAVGRGVTQFRIGERVAATQRSHICGHCCYCRSAREPLCDDAQFMGDAGLNGGYSDYVAVGIDNVARVPDGVELESAAISACAIGTALNAIRDIGRLRLGESVLVTGAGGGVGIHAVQIARASGAIVLAQTTSSAKVAAIRAAGAHHVVLSGRGEDFSRSLKDLTKGAGVAMVIDTVGTPQFHATRRSLAKAGRWVLVGQVTGDFVPFNPAQLFLKSISMLSATSCTRQHLADVLELLARGTLQPVIALTLPLAQAAAAHALIETGGVLGRILLRPDTQRAGA